MYNLRKFLPFIILLLGFSCKEENYSIHKGSSMSKLLNMIEEPWSQTPNFSDRLHQVEWFDIPNWQRETLEKEALACFKKSLPKLQEQDPKGRWKIIANEIDKIDENNPEEILDFFKRFFIPYQLANKDDSLEKARLTSYSEDNFKASFTKTNYYKWPVYQIPLDNTEIGKYTRYELYKQGFLEGKEIAFFGNPSDVFRSELQGSMGALVGEGPNEVLYHLGHDGGNKKTFKSIWRAVRGDANPMNDNELNQYILEDPSRFYSTIDRMNFFKIRDKLIGILGVELTPKRSLAVNKADFDELNLPIGIPVYYSSVDHEDNPDFNRLGFAQDSIAGDTVRINLFYGYGKEATQKARQMGDTRTTRVYVLLPKYIQ